VCTFVRRKDSSSWDTPRIVVAYPNAQPAVPPDPMIPWDPLLEDWLLANGVAASSPQNEAERIGYDLVARLAVIEKRCGSGEYTRVMMRYLYDHDCPLYLPLEKKLGAIRTYEPDPANAKTECSGCIDKVVEDVRQTVEGLGYTGEVAAQIRKEAIAYYMRDRFQISTDVPAEAQRPETRFDAKPEARAV